MATGRLPPYNPNTPRTFVASRRIHASAAYFPPQSATPASSAARAIKPKPQYLASANGTPGSVTPYSGKKRGRPSKAELARREQETAELQAAAEGAISIGADGVVVAGKKRKEPESDEEIPARIEGQSMRGESAQMPAATMMQVTSATPALAAEGQQPSAKRGRGRPRKVRPEEQQAYEGALAMGHQDSPAQPQEHGKPQKHEPSPELGGEHLQGSERGSDDLVVSTEAAHQQVQAGRQGQVPQSDHSASSNGSGAVGHAHVEAENDATKFFQDLRQTGGHGGVAGTHV